MPVLKLRVLRLIARLRRYPGAIAAFGFGSGLASFVLVDRHEGFARVIALLMLASWLWLIFEQLLREVLARRFGFALPAALLRYATQLVHQESLFFALPFFIASTSWNSGQALFTGLVALCALVAIIDPLYYRRLAPRRWLLLAFHGFSLFAVLLVVLPLIFHLPTTQSYGLALGVAVLLSVPALPAVAAAPRVANAALAVAMLAALAELGWQARLWVPPPTLRLTEVALTTAVDDDERAPGAHLGEIDAARLLAEGVFAYTAIRAPLGLEERIQHVWLHEGREVDRVALDIRGGREEGYRAWTRKRNFPPAPQGAWQVRVLSGDGQMIGMLRFRVTEGGAGKAPPPAGRISRSVPTG